GRRTAEAGGRALRGAHERDPGGILRRGTQAQVARDPGAAGSPAPGIVRGPAHAEADRRVRQPPPLRHLHGIRAMNALSAAAAQAVAPPAPAAAPRGEAPAE